MIVVQLPRAQCPRCRAEFDATASMTDGHGVPVPGDVTICECCAGVLIFCKGLTVREITNVDLDKLSVEEVQHIMLTQQHIINTTVQRHVSMN